MSKKKKKIARAFKSKKNLDSQLAKKGDDFGVTKLVQTKSMSYEKMWNKRKTQMKIGLIMVCFFFWNLFFFV